MISSIATLMSSSTTGSRRAQHHWRCAPSWVMEPFGMNLHPLAGWAVHDIETLERYYRHLIARYLDKPPIDLDEECARARLAMKARHKVKPLSIC